MALSEEERKRLQMLEQELASTDPDLDRTLQAGAPGRHPREATTMVHGILTLIAGFTLVIVGITTELIIIGAVGFLLMMAGAHWSIKGLGLYTGPEDPRHET
jgi:UPF0716 family protein affecting phage T7 exclusion